MPGDNARLTNGSCVRCCLKGGSLKSVVVVVAVVGGGGAGAAAVASGDVLPVAAADLPSPGVVFVLISPPIFVPVKGTRAMEEICAAATSLAEV